MQKDTSGLFETIFKIHTDSTGCGWDSLLDHAESHREAAMYAEIDGKTMNQYVSEAIKEKNERRRAMAAV